MAKNKTAIFITNDVDSAKGSSLYVVLPNGTIRCSGANTVTRKATTFTRPYMIGFFHSKKPSTLFGDAICGPQPCEADVDNAAKLLSAMKAGDVHCGNTISEILNLETLFNLKFTPKTWRGQEYGGTLWTTAVKEVVTAISEMKDHHALIPKKDKLVP